MRRLHSLTLVVSEMEIYRQLNPPVPMKGIYFVGVLLNRKP